MMFDPYFGFIEEREELEKNISLEDEEEYADEGICEIQTIDEK